MDTGTYEFSALKSKYKDFLHPAAEISVDGTKLADKYVVFDVEVENTIDNDSVSAAVFKVQNTDNKLKKPEEFSILSAFPLLKKVEIKLGYTDALKTVFTGYIFERALTIDGGGRASELTVTCFCCKAFLRMNTEWEAHKEKAKLSDLVTELLSKYSFSSEIGQSENLAKKMTIVRHGVTDFVYIGRIAEELGYEFFSHEDKIYFRKPMSVSGNIIKLEAANIFRLECKTSMTDMVSKVALYGYNQDTGTAETATADSISKKTGSGKTGVEIMDSFPATHTAYIYMNNKSSKKLDDAAKVYLQAKSMKLVSLTVVTAGLPEIIPGRFMALDKLGEDLNNSYYIHAVRHTQKGNDYKTELHCVANTAAK